MKLLQELGSADKINTFLRSGPGFKAWVECREFAKDIYELQQTHDFEEYQKALNELETTKKTIQSNLDRVNERLRRFMQDVDELHEQLDIVRENLRQWAGEAKTLV